VTNFNLGVKVCPVVDLFKWVEIHPLKKGKTIHHGHSTLKANKKSDEIYFFLRLSISAQ
jgi:hypothetical protein